MVSLSDPCRRREKILLCLVDEGYLKALYVGCPRPSLNLRPTNEAGCSYFNLERRQHLSTEEMTLVDVIRSRSRLVQYNLVPSREEERGPWFEGGAEKWLNYRIQCIFLGMFRRLDSPVQLNNNCPIVIAQYFF